MNYGSEEINVDWRDRSFW